MKLLSSIARVLIRSYRLLLSPLLPAACRFAPTCSDYAHEAFSTHTFVHALRLVIRRVASCHPWGKSGFDPVPAPVARKHS